MLPDQYSHLLDLLSSASVVITFALGYLGGFAQ